MLTYYAAQIFYIHIYLMAAKVGNVQIWCYQIIHRATAGQDRYNTRWGCQQYYWNDITHPIHHYTGCLKSLIYELDKELKAAKAETAYQKKCKVEAEERTSIKTMQLTQQMTQQKNEEKSHIRQLLQEERANKNHFYNKYREYERLFQNKYQQFERVERQLTSMKNKLNAVQSAYTFTKSSGETNQQEKKFILDTVNSVDKNNRVSEVRRIIMDKYGGQWGVVTGLNPGQWSCLSSWDKWYIFASNKKNIFIWKHKTNPIPLQTPYKLQNSYGILSTQDKQTIEQTLNSIIVSDDNVSNKCRNIRTQLVGKLGGEWGVVIGLKDGWGAYYWWDVWAIYSSNLQTVLIWKRCPKSEEKEMTTNQENNDDLNLYSGFDKLYTQMVEQQQVNEAQTQKIEQDQISEQNKKDMIQSTTKDMQQPIEENKPNIDQGFILIQNAGSEGVQEETFIRVLINELVLPTEDPFVRSQWVSELAEKNFGNKWGALVNVSLCQWAQQQHYFKWFVYQCGQKQVLIWCKDGQHQSKNKEEPIEQIKQLPQLLGQVYTGSPKQEAQKQPE